MPNIESFFVTRLYHASLFDFAKSLDIGDLNNACLSIADDDVAGQKWCEKNCYPGYTSYASLSDLPWRFTIFERLVKVLDRHVASFCSDLQFDLKGQRINLDSLWINILPSGGVHTSHIHLNSVISGTTYIAMPSGVSSIKFEDPRLPMMMAAPKRKLKARSEMLNFIYRSPQVGDVLLWESWLRHEVPMNMSDEERISISFNYSIE
ncbi:MAG: TIGR02466 family protein [Paracoccaceae bacterium]|nr:TIGR02466 family protein [Paracoccaceae bacterium]